MKISWLLFAWLALPATITHAQTQRSFQSPQVLHVGLFQSRAIWSSLKSDRGAAVILVPGSGPMGPRELIPAHLTADGKDSAIFDQLATAFQHAGVQTFQLGKPGIEDQSVSDLSGLYYDKSLYSGLHWKDLLNNLDEAFQFVTTQPSVDSQRVWILGHSEGTQVAVDYARQNPHVAGVILLGYAGEDISTVLEWQLFKRVLDDFIETDVDANHDGFVTREEASHWPQDFQWNWQSEQASVSIADIEKALREDPNYQSLFNKKKSSPLYADGIWNRGSIYAETAALTQPVYVFTGSLDEQTPPDEALKLDSACKAVRKKNCVVTIVPGVGHGFSPPKRPRSHPFLDMTVGPVEAEFLTELSILGKRGCNRFYETQIRVHFRDGHSFRMQLYTASRRKISCFIWTDS